MHLYGYCINFELPINNTLTMMNEIVMPIKRTATAAAARPHFDLFSPYLPSCSGRIQSIGLLHSVNRILIAMFVIGCVCVFARV